MKKFTLTICACLLFVCISQAQKTAEERLSILKSNYEIVMQKYNAGTFSIDATEYKECKKMVSKINSYDAATTKKIKEFIDIEKNLDVIKNAAQLGSVTLSSSADGKKTSSSFVAGEPMFVVIKCGMTTVKESLRPDAKDYNKKVLTVYFETSDKSNVGIADIIIPQNQWTDKELIVDLTLNGKNPELKELELAIGKLSKGNSNINVIFPRGEFASSISKNMPRIEIPIELQIKDDKLAKLAETNSNAEYSGITLGKAVRSDKALESELKTIYEKSYSGHKVQRVVIEEDWYDLKEDGVLTYKKINCYMAIKKGGSACYRVYVGFVKENTATDGSVKLGPLKILETGAELKYKEMPCENVNK
ncbi:MAG: hypothetical protein Q8M29_00855 [Bacteroidota bacterium]|nr:hypothetical protein [Bacteroidota bacterium]